MSAADDLDVLRRRFRKLAALAKGNGNEGAVAAGRAATMLREHGADVLTPADGLRSIPSINLRPPDPEWLARCAEAERVRRARAAEATFRSGTKRWGTPEEKAALAAIEAEEHAAFWAKYEAEEPARKAAREAAIEAKRAKDRERRREAKLRKEERQREYAERLRKEAAEAPMRRAKNAAETRAERAAWKAERERRRAAGRESPQPEETRSQISCPRKLPHVLSSGSGSQK
jgi:hypothetical protein